MTRKADGSIFRYLNTDLEIEAPNTLSELAAALDAKGVHPMHVTEGDSGQWYAMFERCPRPDEPDPNIAAMLDAIEALDEPSREAWRNCERREFNVGYDCGDEPWAFSHGFSCGLLRRMSEAGTSLRITLYPPRESGP